MTAPKGNPEKAMILMFPLITLGLFLAGVLLVNWLPKWVAPLFEQLPRF